MPIHTTNYTNTFIETAPDCPTTRGEMPPPKGDEKTIAGIQFDLLYEHPYKYDSDEVLFMCHAIRKGISKNEMAEAREVFFSRGQPCMRASPLTKRYGWGVHSNAEGKIAIYGMETEGYKQLSEDKRLKVVKAVRSKKA